MQKIRNWQWIELEETTSTNDAVKEIDGDKTIITAKRQTAGRGRIGRKWFSQEGNLFLSQIMQSNTPMSELCFIASLSVAETLDDIIKKSSIGIKWPNDVLLNEKKVCGILLEKAENKTIIGLGVNLVSHPQLSETKYQTTDLQEQGVSISREQFLQIYLNKFDENYIKGQKNFAFIRQKWLDKALYINKDIKISQKNKTEAGIFRGIDQNGLLLLEQNGTIKTIAAGDVFL